MGDSTVLESAPHPARPFAADLALPKGLRPVLHLDKTPASGLCRIRVVFGVANPRVGYGTGFFISDDRIATAAHVLYQKKLGGYARSVEVFVRATPLTSRADAVLEGKGYFVPKAFAKKTEPDLDVGFITVQRPGDATAATLKALPDPLITPGRQIAVVGYPAPVMQAYADDGPLTVHKPLVLYHQADVVGGLSGAPLFDTTLQAVIGLHVRGPGDKMPPGAPPSAAATRLTPDILQWLKAGA